MHVFRGHSLSTCLPSEGYGCHLSLKLDNLGSWDSHIKKVCEKGRLKIRVEANAEIAESSNTTRRKDNKEKEITFSSKSPSLFDAVGNILEENYRKSVKFSKSQIYLQVQTRKSNFKQKQLVFLGEK